MNLNNNYYLFYRLVYILAFIFIGHEQIINCLSLYSNNNSKNATQVKATITMMIDPAGDAKYTGRIISDCFERGITLQLAQELKHNIESESENVRIILTRFPGETLEPLQNAAFANRLNTDIFISLSFYQSLEPTYEMYLYRFLYNPLENKLTLNKNLNNLHIYPYNQAYKLNINKVNEYGGILNNLLKNEQSHGYFTYKGLFSIPCKPLIGVTAPCFLFEMALYKKEDWHKWLTPLTTALCALITNTI